MADILLIDDDHQVRELLQEVLEQSGHKVIQCKNGADGIHQYKQSNFDLVILDVLLPDDGKFETLKALKLHHEQVNILAISGGMVSDGENVLFSAQQLGARYSLAKPFDLTHFLSVVNQLLPFTKLSS